MNQVGEGSRERAEGRGIRPHSEGVTMANMNHLAPFEGLDLSPIKAKLMDPIEGQGWSRETVDRVEIAYRRFLQLATAVGDQPHPICPSREIDLFWHQHILDTRKYAADCDRQFGFFLHHFPYFGMRGEEDARALARAFEQTRVLYEQTFGESYVDEMQQCGNTCNHNCQVTCSNRIDETRPTLN